MMPNNLMNMFKQMKANPMAMLAQRLNLPQNLSDPKEINQNLLNSGQINQQQVDQAMQMKKQYFGK